MASTEKISDPYLAALTAMHAVAIAILIAAPIRIKNLAGLDLSKHLNVHKRGTHTRYSLYIPSEEVKNSVEINVKLNARTSRLLTRYIREYHPAVCNVQTDALFPQRSSGASRSPGNLGQSIADLIYRELGLKVHAHLFRHIAAYLFLNAQPGEFESVRRLLGHKKLDTTMTFYASITNEMAQKRYDEVVLSKFGGNDA